VLVGLAGCGTSVPVASNQPYPATGLVLLSLTDGSTRAAASIGSDPVAVTVSIDGATAYVADSSPGDVYAVGLPALKISWKQHVGGAPFGLLLHSGSLYVSLYDGGVAYMAIPPHYTSVESIRLNAARLLKL